jgi:hypothetical protein
MKKLPKIIPIVIIGAVVLLVLAQMNANKVKGEETSSACGCGS